MNISSETLKGTYTAIATPFSKDSTEVDYDSLANLIEFQISAGVQGLVACGSSGEAQTLTDIEYQQVVSFVLKTVRNRVAVIAGIGSNATLKATQMAKFLVDLKVDGILVVAPPYNKPTQKGIIAHFEEIKKTAPLPIIAYNVPGRTSVNILPQTIATLNRQGIICGVKEASGNMEQVIDLLGLVRNSCSVLSGECALVLPTMACGGQGTISATANIIPDIFVEITSTALKGDWKAAKEAQFKALPWVRATFMETNPIPLKAALYLRGVIAHPSMRLPLCTAEESTFEKFKSLISTL